MDAQLLSLPCGCVIDSEAQLSYIKGGFAECPWCSCSFVVEDWVASMRQSGPQPMWIVKPQVIVRFGDDILELLGDCGDCGSHLVRQCGGSKFHLTAPESMLENLRN